MNDQPQIQVGEPLAVSSVSSDAAALSLGAADRPSLGADAVTGFAAVSAGSIIARCFEVLRRRLLVVMAMAAIVLSPELVLLIGLRHGHFLELFSWAARSKAVFAFVWFSISGVLAGIAAAPITYVVVMATRGTPAPVGEALRQGLRRLVPAASTALVVYAVGTLAMPFLLVPGLILFSMWNVAVPAVVIERVGVFAALGRSRALTRGYRASIFGAFILMLAARMFVGWVLKILGASGNGSDASLITLWLLEVIFAAFLAVAAAVTYHDLRLGKEGVQTDELARIFD